MTARPAAAPNKPSRAANFGPFLIVLVAATAVIITEVSTGRAWSLLFLSPLLNALILLDRLLLGQFGLAIIVFTLLLRLVTLPFTVNMYQSMKAMQSAQPLIQEISKKYKDPKRRQEETLRLYREHGINPLGCLMPQVIQFAVFIALYRALIVAVGGSPESLVGLSEQLYPIAFLRESIPLEQHFLWLDLGGPDSTYILPLLVGFSTYVQQKVSITPNASPQQAQQQQMLTWMMPLILFWITLTLPSGVGVYWVVTNIFSLFVSYYVYGRSFNWRQIFSLSPPALPDPKAAASAKKRDEPITDQESDIETPDASSKEARPPHGKRRGKRKNRR